MTASGPPGRSGTAPVDVVAVVGLVALAAVLRAGPLAPGSLWLDDAWPAMVSRAGSLGDVLLVGLTAPGFVALLGAVLAVGGRDPAVAQALPFACGVLAVPAVYAVARQARLARGAALVAAGVLLTSPVHLTYSTRVKQYTLEALAVLAVTSAALAVARRPDRARAWAVLLAVAVTGTVASSVVAVPASAALGAAGIAAVAAGRADGAGPRALRLAAGTGLAWLAFAAAWWVGVVRPAANPALTEFWAPFLGPGSPAAWPGVLDGLAPVPVVVAGAVLAAGAVAVARRGPVLAVLVLGAPAAAAVLALAGVAPLGGGRTDVYLYPVLCLVVGAAGDAAGRLLRRAAGARAAGPGARAAGGLAAAAVVAGLVAAAPAPQPYPGEDVAPLVRRVDAQARAGDVVLVYSATRWGHAYATAWPVRLVDAPALANGFDVAVQAPPGVRVAVLPPQRGTPEGHAVEVPPRVAGAQRVWLLTSHTSGDVAAVGEALTAAGLRRVDVDAREGAELTLWQRG